MVQVVCTLQKGVRALQQDRYNGSCCDVAASRVFCYAPGLCRLYDGQDSSPRNAGVLLLLGEDAQNTTDHFELLLPTVGLHVLGVVRADTRVTQRRQQKQRCAEATACRWQDGHVDS